MRNKQRKNEILHEITSDDLQYAAQRRLGRKLNKIELNKAKKYLQVSFGEARPMILSAVFDNLCNK